jgi:hypothetical protein
VGEENAESARSSTSRPASWLRLISAGMSVASRAEPALPLRSRWAAITGAI